MMNTGEGSSQGTSIWHFLRVGEKCAKNLLCCSLVGQGKQRNAPGYDFKRNRLLRRNKFFS